MSTFTAKIALSAGLALGALTLGAASASAMAIDPGVATTVGRTANIEDDHCARIELGEGIVAARPLAERHILKHERSKPLRVG